MENPSTSLFPAPAVEDNEARYCFFLPAPATPQTDAQALAAATQRCREFLALAEQQTRGFLWHRHRFHLQVAPRRDCRGCYYLTGRTSVGDAIQDEWVVAALCFELTRRFPGVVARLADTDGEFLLIESAEALPDWVTPEASDRRVFILDGQLHIAPPTDPFSSSNTTLYDDDALLAVTDPKVPTKASDAVQRLLRNKLDEVPTYLRENRHSIRCVLPQRAADVLLRRPELVGPAVEAFYYREPKHASFVWSNMTTFLPPDESVEVQQMVTFSRAMFAQLKYQELFPPKPFLRSRRSPFHVLQALKSEGEAESQHPDALAADMGMKLTCGLELLHAGDEKDQLGQPWSEMIDESLAEQTTDSPVRPPIEPDDDDSWLYMHPDTLESQLQRAAAAGAGGAGGAEELQGMAAMFGKFVDGVSGVEGVEGSEPVQFDMSSLMSLLSGDPGAKSDLNAPWGQHFMDEDEPSESDSDDEMEDAGAQSEEDLALEQAMAEMEAELAGTKVSESFSRFEEIDEQEAEDEEKKQTTPSAGGVDAQEENSSATTATFSSSEKPLDLDYNLLSNLLESFASQEGHAGPVSTILGEMNFPPPAP